MVGVWRRLLDAASKLWARSGPSCATPTLILGRCFQRRNESSQNENRGPHGTVCFLISEIQDDKARPLVNDFIASHRGRKIFSP